MQDSQISAHKPLNKILTEINVQIVIYAHKHDKPLTWTRPIAFEEARARILSLVDEAIPLTSKLDNKALADRVWLVLSKIREHMECDQEWNFDTDENRQGRSNDELLQNRPAFEFLRDELEDEIALLNEDVKASLLAKSATIPENALVKKTVHKRGRPPSTDQAAAKRTLENYEASLCKSPSEYARAKGLDEKETERQVDAAREKRRREKTRQAK